MNPPEPVTVRQLLSDNQADLVLTLRAGDAGLTREISVPRIQKPGLALTGYTEQLHRGRVIVLGGTEIDYMGSIEAEQVAVGVSAVMASLPACIVITRGLAPPEPLAEACRETQVPLLVSALTSADFITEITDYLEEQMAPHTTVHGVMLDVLGIGILLLGRSGVGKSEIALDLVARGHRLVADDVVEIRRPTSHLVYGSSASIIRHHMEIRGLGIINIKDLFGISSVRETKKIELVIELSPWDVDATYDRLGLDEEYYEVLEVSIPMLRLPVSPGRAMATIIEVAARNQLLKLQGYHSARDFQEKLDRAILFQTPHRYDIDRVE